MLVPERSLDPDSTTSLHWFPRDRQIPSSASPSQNTPQPHTGHQPTLSRCTFSNTENVLTNTQFAAFFNERGNQEEGGETWLDLESEFIQIV